MAMNHLQVVMGWSNPSIGSKYTHPPRSSWRLYRKSIWLSPVRGQAKARHAVPPDARVRVSKDWMNGFELPWISGGELREFRILEFEEKVFWIYIPKQRGVFYKLLRWTWKNLVFPTELWIHFFRSLLDPHIGKMDHFSWGWNWQPVFGWLFWCVFSRAVFLKLFQPFHLKLSWKSGFSGRIQIRKGQMMSMVNGPTWIL